MIFNGDGPQVDRLPVRRSRLCNSGKALTVLLALYVLSGCAALRRTPATQGSAVFFPPPPDPPRIAYLTSINDDRLFARPPSRMSRFLFGNAAIDSAAIIGKPFGLATQGQELFVCDTQLNIVHVFDFAHNRSDVIGDAGRGRLIKPVDVAVDQDGNRYVADTGRHEIVVFSPTNEPLRSLRPSRAGELDNAAEHQTQNQQPPKFKPLAVAFHSGKLFVADASNHQIVVMDPVTGAVLSEFGASGQSRWGLLLPSGLAVDSTGRTFVADSLNGRVQVFSPDGSFLRTIGRPGDRAGEFARPKHLSIADDGIAYVVDAAFQRVQMFDEVGDVLMHFGGSTGRNEHERMPGSLVLPAGVSTSRQLLSHFAEMIPKGFKADYLVFVSDQLGDGKINVYAMGYSDPS